MDIVTKICKAMCNDYGESCKKCSMGNPEAEYSCSVYEGLSEYIIPTDNLQKNCLYLVKHLEEGKMKRKQGWAKFML